MTSTSGPVSDQLLRSAEYRAAGYWGEETLPVIVDRWADDDPSRPYLSDGTGALTYGEFRVQAWALAAALSARGIRPGDRIAVQLPNWNEFFLVYAACARLGVVMIPVVVVYRGSEVGFIVENSGASALVTCGEFRGFDHAAMAAEITGAMERPPLRIVVRGKPDAGAVALEDLLAFDEQSELPPQPSADDRHLILYSSGTESRPKGCLHTWNTSSFLPKQAVAALGMTRDDVMFMPSPVTHALGLTLGVMAPTLAGASVHLLDIFSPATALERIAAYGCTGTASPAPFIRMMLDAYDPAVHDVSRLRFWLSAGAPIPASLVQDAATRFSGCRVVSAYGSSEVMMATVCRPEDPVERVASSDGGPVPGVEIRVVGGDGRVAPTGADGEIRYRGPGRLLEYWGRPDLTAAALDDEGWWGTGDLGRLDETGYLRVTGRIKDIIIRGGFNISAREVEEALLAHPAITNVAVIGLPDPQVGERACAVIETNDHASLPTLDQMREYLTVERRMAVWKTPERIERVTEWPVTATGKIQKFVLRRKFGESP
jgi:cyclohexanecarboxylate-CoA ligase/acyl-CoA synthetase